MALHAALARWVRQQRNLQASRSWTRSAASSRVVMAARAWQAWHPVARLHPAPWSGLDFLATASCPLPLTQFILGNPQVPRSLLPELQRLWEEHQQRREDEAAAVAGGGQDLDD